LIVGAGYLGEELKRTAKRLNQRIIFLNRVSDDLLPLYYAAADVVALPSLYEGGPPLTLLEAMASGKPVVTTNLPPMTELADNSTAVTMNPNNSELFVEKITSLLLNEQYRRVLGSKARSRVVECFTWEKVAEETEKVYEEAVSEE
jgi:glycosyltransferase involved in cell wall biosynthesis